MVFTSLKESARRSDQEDKAGRAPPHPRPQVMGVPLDPVTMDETLRQCLEWIRGDRKPRLVLTINAAVVVELQRNPQLREAIDNAALVLADGMPMVWMSGLTARPVPERITGVDLMAHLLENAEREHLRIFFLGARQAVVEALVERVNRAYPGLQVAGFHHGYFQEDQWRLIIRQIRESHADILLVGMPSPFKETWSRRHLDALGTPVVLGVGGSFDVLAGYVRRAPVWMQKTALEWAWRLLMEPRKMCRRYMASNTVFIGLVARELLRRARSAR